LTALAVAAAALATRAAFTLAHGPAPLVAEMAAYWDAARGLLAGRGFHAGHGFRAFIPPGYAFFLAAIQGFGGGPLAARLAQAALGAATAVLTYLYARAAFGEAVGRLAGFAFALWPASWVFGDFVLTEALFTFLFMAGLTAWGDGSSWRGVAAAGLCWGLAALTRELALLFLPFICLCYFLTRNPKLAVKAVVAAAIVGACVAPWTVRNYRVLGGFVPVTTKSGVDFYIYNHNNFKQILANESDQPSETKLFADARDELDLARLARRRAWTWIAGHPGLFVVKGVRTEMNFLGLERDFFQHQMYGYYPPLPKGVMIPAFLAFILPSAVAFPLAFVAALRHRRNRHLAAGLYVILLYLVITFAAYSFTRQRYPLTPLVITLAAAAWHGRRDLWTWLKGRRWALAAAAAFTAFLAAAWLLEIYLDAGEYLGRL